MESVEQRDDGIDRTIGDLVEGGYASEAVIATRRDVFVNSNLFAGTDTAQQGLSWATWDPEALFVALTGDRDAGLQDVPQPSTQDADVTETTYAGYVQANLDTEMFGKRVTGNIGMRVIRTDIESVGISANLITMIDPEDPEQLIVLEDGDSTLNLETNGFWNFLPSANLNFELQSDLFLRVGVYRAMSRPDPEAMSAALAFDDNAPLLALGDIVRASGNPFIEPLESWNFDLSLEYYPSDDSAFSVAVYAKALEASFTNVTEDITLNVDGADQVVTVGRVGNSSEGSELIGVEVSAQHIFSNLPGALSGLGVQVGYGFADSNFEFPDPRVIGATALADFTEPANIPGYSRHTGNVAVFWEQGPANVRLAYKVRSSYFKPFRQDANRFTAKQGFLDFSASYDITDWAEVRLQGLNLLDEPNVFFRPTTDSLAQTDISGRRFFIGARLRF